MEKLSIMEAQSTTPPHALVIPWPRQGHINPLMRLSKKLSKRGFLITFLHSERNLKRLITTPSPSPSPSPPLSLSSPSPSPFPSLSSPSPSPSLSSPSSPSLSSPSPSPFASSNNIRLVGLPDGLPLDHPRTDIVELASSIFRFMAAAFEDLVNEKKHEITCIISDFYMSFTLEVGKKFGIPVLPFFPQSASSLACHLLIAQGYRPPQGIPFDSPENLITCIPGTPPLKQTDMLHFFQSYDPSDALFDFGMRPMKKLHESPIILLNTFDGLELDTMEGLQKLPELHHSLLLTLGPLLPSLKSEKETMSLWREDEECMSWLDSKPPTSVLYIAFGSNATLSVRQLEEIAKGVESSGVPFLLVLRPGLLPEGASFSSRLHLPLGHFVRWAPQLRVLSHPSIGGFLTHCGWNSTLESISCGVPMLGWPYFADQMLNCHCIANAWHLGLRLEKDIHGMVGKEEVEKKVKILMSHNEGEGKIIWERAQHFKKEAQTCRMEGGSSHGHFDAMITKITQLIDICHKK